MITVQKNMKKILLVLFMLGSMNTFSVIPYEKEWTCPVDNEKFKVTYTDVVSYNELPVCPTSKFVMFKKDYTQEEIQKYKEIVNSKEYRNLRPETKVYYRLEKLMEMSGLYSNFKIGLIYHVAAEDELGLSYTLLSIKWNEELLSDSLYSEEALENIKKSLEYYEKEKREQIRKLNNDNETKKLYENTISYMEKVLTKNFSLTGIKDKNENKNSHDKELIAKFVIIDSYRRLKDYKKAKNIINKIKDKKMDNKEQEILDELKTLIANKDNVLTAEKLSSFVYDLALEDFGLSSH